MSAKSRSVFEGFPPETLAFLSELAEHNDREWFAGNKPRYESDVLAPALDFIAAASPLMQRISGHFDVIPKRQGGSLMRVYRDTRFGHDKRPYKTNIGIHFRHQLGKDVHAPGYYVHIEPHECFLGAGMWRPDAPSLKAIRERIDERPDEWKKVLASRPFRRDFNLGGDSLKRAPRGYPDDHALVEDLKRRDFIAVANYSPDDIHDATFVKSVVKKLSTATPLVRFLCNAITVPF